MASLVPMTCGFNSRWKSTTLSGMLEQVWGNRVLMPHAAAPSPLEALFACVWDAVEADAGPARRPVMRTDDAGAAVPLLASGKDRHPATRHLDAALAAAERSANGRIPDLVRAASDLLVWCRNPSYTEDNVGRHFLDNFVTGMLTGPEGNLARALPVSGFVLMGPHMIYPTHRHAPREVYLVLTPNAEWSFDDTRWIAVRPGQVVHHASWQGHAMRSGETPFLAFAAWLDHGDRGAIDI